MKPVKSRKLQIGKQGATALRGIQIYRPTIAPAAVAAATVVAQTFTVTGLKTSDSVDVNPGVGTIGVSGAYVSADDTLTVVFTNPTAGEITPASSTWTVKATRS